MLIKREGKVWYHILISSKSSPSQTPLGSAIYVMKDKLVWCVLSSRRYQQPPTTNTHAATFVFTGRQPDINPLHQIKTRTTKSAERDDLYTSFDKEIRLRLPSPCPSPPRAPSALHTRAQFHFFNAFHYSPPPPLAPALPLPPNLEISFDGNAVFIVRTGGSSDVIRETKLTMSTMSHSWIAGLITRQTWSNEMIVTFMMVVTALLIRTVAYLNFYNYKWMQRNTKANNTSMCNNELGDREIK